MTSRLLPPASAPSPRLKATGLGRVVLLAAIILIASCKTGSKPDPATTRPTTAPVPVSSRIISLTGHALPREDSRDPQPQLNAMVHLDVYTVELPEGSVTANEDFWKRVDEQAVGVGLEDRLFRSGIRTGLVPKILSPYFSQFFDKNSIRTRMTTVNGLHAETIELDVGEKLRTQDLFYFDSKGQDIGRTYDDCVDYFALGFGPTPRNPGGVRLTLCPVVKSERQRLQYTSLNQEYESSPKDEIDQLFEIGINVDLPDDSFFIVAPSIDARRPSSLGGRFLIKSDKSERVEQVIVIVPTFLRLDGKPVDVNGLNMKNKDPDAPEISRTLQRATRGG